MTASRGGPDEQAPPGGELLRALLLLIGGVLLADATGQLADRLLALASPLAASPEGGEAGRLVLWATIWMGACGLLFQRNWARRLLLVLLGLRTLGLVYALVRIEAFSHVEGTAWVYALASAALYPAALVALWRGHVVTPVPPPPVSRARAAAVAGLVALIVALFALDRLVSPAPVDLSSLPRTAQGELDVLAGHTRWRGERVKLVAVRDGAPVRQAVAKWDLTFVPNGEGGVFVQGLHFAQNVSVYVDVTRNAMLIHDTYFAGRPISGESPLFDQVPFRGVTFEARGGRIHGSASIIVLEDGRVGLDFDKVFIDGRRSREYGSVTPDPTSAVAAVDSTSRN